MRDQNIQSKKCDDVLCIKNKIQNLKPFPVGKNTTIILFNNINK
jgi:hypothetical protein